MKYTAEVKIDSWWQTLGTYKNLRSAQQACEGENDQTRITDSFGNVIQTHESRFSDA